MTVPYATGPLNVKHFSQTIDPILLNNNEQK